MTTTCQLQNYLDQQVLDKLLTLRILCVSASDNVNTTLLKNLRRHETPHVILLLGQTKKFNYDETQFREILFASGDIQIFENVSQPPLFNTKISYGMMEDPSCDHVHISYDVQRRHDLRPDCKERVKNSEQETPICWVTASGTDVFYAEHRIINVHGSVLTRIFTKRAQEYMVAERLPLYVPRPVNDASLSDTGKSLNNSETLLHKDLYPTLKNVKKALGDTKGWISTSSIIENICDVDHDHTQCVEQALVRNLVKCRPDKKLAMTPGGNFVVYYWNKNSQ